VLERAGAKHQTYKLARKLLEQRVHYSGNDACVKLIKANIGSELIDDYPPSKLKDLLISAGLAYCPKSFESAQWYLIPLGAYKECWESVQDFANNNNQALVDAMAEQINQLQQEKANTEARFIGLEMQMDQLKQDMTAVWAAIKHIEEHDKPVTEEKLRRHLRLVSEG
jgi:hypothetical protein